MVPGFLKLAVRRVIGRSAPGTWRRLSGPALLVLTYHRVLPDGHADRAQEQPGMYVRPETLDMHLRTLREHFEVVHLDDWLELRAAGRPMPRLACAITFDDGWRDNYQHAFPVLMKNSVPGTIFLVSALVGGAYSFWPNRLARQLARTDKTLATADWPEPLRGVLAASGVLQEPQAARPGPDGIDRAIMACKSFTDAEMNEYLDRLPPLDGAATRDLLDADEVRAMAKSGLVRFGSHTRRHTRLHAGLSPEALADEIQGSAQEIERLVGRRPTLFCYPNGDHTPEAVSEVRKHYRGAASTSHGWNDTGLDTMYIRRVGMHEDVSGTRDEFLARIEQARWRRATINLQPPVPTP
jgi:peptidoglycan/xylan/chitin deacetylase (PgdA/CDA1 family)